MFAPDSLIRLFDRVAVGYGRAALRFLPFAADRITFRLRPRRGEKILDVASGTGTVALALARMVQPGGRVFGVELAEGMLEEAEGEAARRGLTNADWQSMDGQQLEFRAGYFHGVACNAGLLYMPDPPAALREWQRVLRSGGRLVLTTFSAAAFEPMAGLLVRRLRAAGCPLVRGEPGFPWHRLGDADLCQSLVADAGFEDVALECLQVGFHLARADDWWEVVWNTELRGLIETLPEPAQARLRLDHLDEVAALAQDEGIWMNVEMFLIAGRKPTG